MLMPPIDLQAWIEGHRELLKPPVGNKCIVDGDFIVMVVGGPNARTDYHYDEGPEFFYQLEGEMVLRVQDEGRARDITIRAGELFYLPPKVPHSPQRPAGGVGLVIERRRLEGERDGLMWFCERCNHLLFETYFPLGSIETDFPPVFERFYRSHALRTCDACGHLNPAPAKYEDIDA
ncbi:3-hydroxyanthranilate 3,4-dioxygenase [Coralloluteibacterium stylophorae]|uniref:3-hydroxyanthranilate 3,4-dioxygenase n=1 Tax=Coralloluteibacterium stylophorae TaxID=1776034 RepID=A0A8J7VU88_9GAMM|nr:3-hydroxyanthranilate 3,4-dioxygenase [Coralloluteibacterium stylophorae]MBS7455959.1 3-hydroxyanthranilate 3,4-dioxygenase [Coralloluteibacterium stylophorae]